MRKFLNIIVVLISLISMGFSFATPLVKNTNTQENTQANMSNIEIESNLLQDQELKLLKSKGLNYCPYDVNRYFEISA